MIALYEQQTRDMLARHQNTAKQQLQNALVAQAAGVAFDRAKFDQHQNTLHQMIVHDFYSRARQLRMLVWQHQQHLLARAQTPSAGDVPSAEQASMPVQVDAQASPESERVLQSSQNTANEEEQLFEANRAPPNGDIEKHPRMQEIERQMAEAGLGPSASSNASVSSTLTNVVLRGKQRRSISSTFRTSQKTSTRKGTRRLESMTDRDQELVFRVHLRQVESAAVYKDDYYHTVMDKKGRNKVSDVFAELAATVQRIRSVTKERGKEGLAIGSHKGKKPNGAISGGDGQLAGSPSGSEHVSRTFANALGSVQSWNPRAPRRVMDYGRAEGGSEAGGKQGKMLLDDTLVQVRQEIENGYDIIAAVHDICRGESAESIEGQVRMLLDTLQLQHEQRFVTATQEERETWLTTRFFEHLCSGDKGRRYLEHVVELLDAAEIVKLMPALCANLGAMISAVRRSRDTGEAKLPIICKVLLGVLQEEEAGACDCLWMVQSFVASHSLGEGLLLSAIASPLVAHLLYSCSLRVIRGLAHRELLEEDVSRAHVSEIIPVLIGVLPSAFQQAGSAERIWDVVAGLDGLLTKESRRHYRSELNRLLKQGDIPGPPTVSPEIQPVP